MKQIISLTFFFLFFFQISFSQNDVNSKYEKANEAYNQESYKEVVLIIKEIKPLYKTVPPKVLSLEILAKSEIIKNNPLDDYALISDTRNQANKYLNNPNNKRDKNYNAVVRENSILKNYPKDLTSFNDQKEADIKEAALQKEREVKAAAEEKARLESVAIEAKARQEREAIERKERLEQEKIKNEQLAVEREKYRVSEAEADAKRANEAKRNAGKINSYSTFSSIGFQSGEIAKYGFLYERGGRKTVGFRFSARTSLTAEEDILNGTATENKTEIELGPNFKITKSFYLNLGVGYGYYDRILNNDYAGEVSLEKTGYSVVTTGIMIRLSRLININGGAAFMDIEKDFYKPEITFGISFNLKGKYK